MWKWDIVRNMFSLVAKEENMMGRLLENVVIVKDVVGIWGRFISHMSMEVYLDRANEMEK